MRRFMIKKLVRDKFPALAQEQQCEIVMRAIDEPQYLQELKAKLIEEAIESCAARDTAELIEELADLMDVADALMVGAGISADEVQRAREKKAVAKGGFAERQYMEHIDIPASHRWIAYYEAKPEQYPELEYKASN